MTGNSHKPMLAQLTDLDDHDLDEQAGLFLHSKQTPQQKSTTPFFQPSNVFPDMLNVAAIVENQPKSRQPSTHEANVNYDQNVQEESSSQTLNDKIKSKRLSERQLSVEMTRHGKPSKNNRSSSQHLNRLASSSSKLPLSSPKKRTHSRMKSSRASSDSDTANSDDSEQFVYQTNRPSLKQIIKTQLTHNKRSFSAPNQVLPVEPQTPQTQTVYVPYDSSPYQPNNKPIYAFPNYSTMDDELNSPPSDASFGSRTRTFRNPSNPHFPPHYSGETVPLFLGYKTAEPQPPPRSSGFFHFVQITFMLTLIFLALSLISLLITFTTLPLVDMNISKISNVLATEKELVFDLFLRSNNRNLITLSIYDADIGIYCNSSIPILPDSVNTTLQPIPKGVKPAIYLGNIDQFDEPVSFPPGFMYEHPSSAVITQIRLRNPGVTEDDEGIQDQEKWAEIIQHPYELIVRGLLKYSLWFRPHVVRVCGTFSIDPSTNTATPSNSTFCDSSNWT